MEKWQGGDRSAGSILIERYFRLLYRFFRNKVGEAVEDLVQRTFLVCVEKKDEVRDAASFRAYLLAVARSELVAHYRRRGRERDRFDALETSAYDLDPSPSAVAVQKQEQRLLVEALRRIPVDFQIAIELYYWEGATAPELAQVLQIPEGTVRSRLRRGKEILRERMSALAESDALLGRTLSNVDALVTSLRDSADKPS